MNLREAAAYLEIAPKTLYKWKRQARQNNGFLIIHGKAVPFHYRQTGAAGQGRIMFETEWLDELKRAMEGNFPPQRKAPRPSLSQIHVELGIPQG